MFLSKERVPRRSITRSKVVDFLKNLNGVSFLPKGGTLCPATPCQACCPCLHPSPHAPQSLEAGPRVSSRIVIGWRRFDRVTSLLRNLLCQPGFS